MDRITLRRTLAIRSGVCFNQPCALAGKYRNLKLECLDMDNLAIIVVHPDDWEFGMGGTALLLKDRYKFHVLMLSRGERGYPWNGPEPKPPSREVAAIREAEERAACAMIGADVTFLDQIDGEVYPNPPLVERLAEHLRRINPVAIFTMWGIEVPDHSATSWIALKALSLTGMHHDREVYYMECGMGGQTNQFDPDLYVNITEVIEQKKALGRCHVCQNPDDKLVQAHLQQSTMRGKVARCDHAEPFKTFLPLVNRRWGRKVGHLLLDI